MCYCEKGMPCLKDECRLYQNNECVLIYIESEINKIMLKYRLSLCNLETVIKRLKE